MADVQIPSYLAAGFPIVAIASRTQAHARPVAERHGIADGARRLARRCSTTSAVEVVDIAFPPDQQLEIDPGRPASGRTSRAILVQKPIAVDFAEAKRAVEACANSGKTLAVNQNMRYDQSMRALKTALDRGDLGEPVLGDDRDARDPALADVPRGHVRAAHAR